MGTGTTRMDQKWPDILWIVRHGESAGNVARDAASVAGRPEIDIAQRDMDVPLSPLGERQAAALGRWFAGLPPDARPQVILSSPYVRARHTAEMVRATAGIDDRTSEPESEPAGRVLAGARERGQGPFGRRRVSASPGLSDPARTLSR